MSSLLSFNLTAIRPAMLNIVVLLWIIISTAGAAFAVTFNGTNTGAIPDGSPPTPTCGAPRDVVFAVAGFGGSIGSVTVRFTMAPEHTFIGHLQAFLISPDGTSHVLFSRVGANTPGSAGDSSNLDGTYSFSDFTNLNIWTAANSGGGGFDVPPGVYRTQAAGPFVNDSPGPPFTSMNAVFAAIPSTSRNGNWTLRFLDCSGGAVGTVSAAQLTLIPTSAGSSSIRGRVSTASGTGIRNVIVTISGGDLLEPVNTRTGSFGNFTFDGLESGQAYFLSVQSRRFSFDDPFRTVNLDQDLFDVSFVANE